MCQQPTGSVILQADVLGWCCPQKTTVLNLPKPSYTMG
jgi:hypothetical protein